MFDISLLRESASMQPAAVGIAHRIFVNNVSGFFYSLRIAYRHDSKVIWESIIKMYLDAMLLLLFLKTCLLIWPCLTEAH
jgi:hypothetical protein